MGNDQGQQQMEVVHGSRDDYVDQIVIPKDIACDRCTLNWFWHGDPAFEDTTFSNCIDISIHGDAPSPSPVPTPTPTPVPSGCPGGSLASCIGSCPSDAAVYQVCVEECLARCSSAEVDWVA